MTDYEIMRKAISHYGEKCQQDKAIEEMSELTKAIMKLRYAEKDYEKKILCDAVDEEMADVEIMLEQLKMIFENRTRIETQKIKKLDRLNRRMDHERSQE